MASLVGHPVTQVFSQGNFLLLSPSGDNASLSAAVAIETQNGVVSNFQDQFTLFLWRVVPPPVILLGTAGNCLSFLVMRRRRLCGTRMSLCLRLLAVVDTIVLWTGYLRYWVWKTFGTDVRTLPGPMCNVQSWLVAVSSQFAAWVIICITLDRFCAIFAPHFAKRHFSKLRTCVVLSIVFLGLSLINSHFFWSIRRSPEGVCDINTDITWLADFFKSAWPWVDLSLYSIIPSIIIAICNFAIIIKLRLSRKQKHYLTQRQQLSSARVNSMTTTLLVISCMYLVTTLPISTFMLVHIVNINRLSRAQWMWFAVVNLLSYLNSASNFLLYLVSSSYFRAELVDLLTCGRRSSSRPPMADTGTSGGRAGRFRFVPPGGGSGSQGAEDLISKDGTNDGL